MDTQIKIDLATALLLAPRFKGRAALAKLAQAGDATAVRALGLSPQLRVWAALRGELSPEVGQIVAQAELAAQRATQLERAAARWTLAYSTPQQLLEAAVIRQFRAAIRAAGFRTAEHVHTGKTTYVAPGAESAQSTSERISSRSAGLPAAYARKGFAVASSDHRWFVSRRIREVSEHLRAVAGVVYLAPDVRVRQGRGTSLVVERRQGERGGWQ